MKKEVVFPAGDLASRIASERGALTVNTVAAYLGLSKSSIYEMASDGSLPHFRFGAAIRFDPAGVAAWLREQKVNAIPKRRAA